MSPTRSPWDNFWQSYGRGVFGAFLRKTLDFRRNAPKTPTAITLPKIVPKASSWTQKMRLGILYNLCAKSGAKQIFRRSYGDLGIFDPVAISWSQLKFVGAAIASQLLFAAAVAHRCCWPLNSPWCLGLTLTFRPTAVYLPETFGKSCIH